MSVKAQREVNTCSYNTGLNEYFRFPVGELTIMQVLFPYAPAPADRNLLPLNIGDRVAVLDQTEQGHGWIKAFNGNRIGYIPKDFVGPLDHVDEDSEP